MVCYQTFKISSLALLCLCFVSAPLFSENHPASSVLKMALNQNLKKSFPQFDGLVWSYSVNASIFKQAGFSVKTQEYPSKRLKVALINGRTDCVLAPSDFFMQDYAAEVIRAELPMTIVNYYIYYNKQKGWRPVWPPDAKFKKKLGKSHSLSELFHHKYGLNTSHAATVDSIIKMLHLNRIDYWLDYRSIRTQVSPGLLRSEQQGYAYHPLHKHRLYLYFQNNNRGKTLKQIYDAGHLQILKQGNYYILMQQPVVLIDDESIYDTIEYIQQNYPHYQIPEQKRLR